MTGVVDLRGERVCALEYRSLMRFQVTFYRDGDPAATVEVDALTEGEAVTAALADGRIPDRDRVLDGPWTATVDPIAAT